MMMLGVLLVQILSSISFVIFKQTLSYGQPFFLVAIRMLLAGTLIFGYYLLFEKRIKITINILFLLLAIGIFNIYITSAFELWGLRYVTAAKASFIYNLAPVLTASFSYFILGDKLTFKKRLGLLIAFLGFIPVFMAQSAEEIGIQYFGVLSLGELALICATIGTSIGWVLVKKLRNSTQSSIAFINGSTMLIGGFVALINSYFVESWNPVPLNNYGMAILYSILGMISLYILVYNLYIVLLKRFSATFLSLTGLIRPLITAILGFIFLGESVSLDFFISFVIVFCGLYIFYLQEATETAKS